jgi:MFS family permease
MTILSPPTGKRAGAVQGWTLTSVNWLAVIATVVLSPVLPKITQHFRSDPHVDFLISLVATLPALFVAICAWPAGLLADRIGRRRVLLFGVGVYGFVGCAPMALNSLLGIVITRAGVGITESIIMVCTTALVADYFPVSQRESWLAIQSGGGGVIAIIMVAAGGLLGQSGWRLPFLMYGAAFVLFPLCLFGTWEQIMPEGSHEGSPKANAGTLFHRPSFHAQPAAERYNWAPLAWICILGFLASSSFYVMLVQFSFILTERGVTDQKTIGFQTALAVLFMLLGSGLFKLMRLPVVGKLTVSFTLSAVGFFVMALSRGLLFTDIGAAINGLGSGIVLPCLLTWALSKLSPAVRARGSGLWQMAWFLGQFASPLSILLFRDLTGSRSSAILIYAIGSSIGAAVALVAYFQGGAQPLLEAE